MASGLSRRRAAGASSAAQDEDIGSTWPTSNGTNGDTSVSPSGSSADINGQPKLSHAGSAFEGGSKIAYDPRDLEGAGEADRVGGKMPKLTIMEEVLLLGLKDKQGYLSFWNDNISYALRGCILLELAMRRRICMIRDSSRKRYPLAERLIEVIDDRRTGETILDEALKMMKGQEEARMSVNSWIDLLSGETWNITKIGFQLKQVRERLAKGLVDKGVLRTEKRNFLLFDMATHPVADARTKESIVRRCTSLLTSSTRTMPTDALGKEGENCRATRTVCLVCASYAASVLDNCFTRLGYEEREAAFQRAEDVLAEFSSWPFGVGGSSGSTSRRKEGVRIGVGSGTLTSRESVLGMVDALKAEMHTDGPGSSEGEDLCFELIAAVLDVLSKLDSLL